MAVEEATDGPHVAVVTGSTSGIGRAIAVELASAGYDIVVHGRANETGAEETARLIEAFGRRATIAMADIVDPRACERLIDEAWSQQPVDVWINNAGADVLTTELAERTFEEKLERLWQVDVLGTMRLSRLVGARMKANDVEAGRSTIINIGWDQADFGMAGDSGEMFGAIKGAIMSFTRSLAKTLAPKIRVNCIAPGWIKTSWGDDASDYWQQRAIDESLLARWGTPEDVARVARFLASTDANFITGQTINVNGGLRISNAK